MLNEKSKLHTETYNVIIFMNIHKTTQNILQCLTCICGKSTIICMKMITQMLGQLLLPGRKDLRVRGVLTVPTLFINEYYIY